MLDPDVHHVTRAAMVADAAAARRVGYGQWCGTVQRHGAMSTDAVTGWELGS